MLPKQPPKPVDSRPKSSAERVKRHRARQKALISDLVSALKEVRVFVNPEEGTLARLALRKAEAVLKRAGEPPITDHDYDEED